MILGDDVNNVHDDDPFAMLTGAVVAAGGAIAHFGSPLTEQRALASGDAIVSLAHQGIIVVSGEDRLSWLHAMTSQHLSDLAAGDSVETLLLDQRGRIEYAIRLVDDGEQAWLLVDEGLAAPLFEYLLRMRFAKRVEVHDVSDEYATVLAFDGGLALPALDQLGCAVVQWRDQWAQLRPGGAQYAQGEHAAAHWSAVQLVFARQQLASVTELFGQDGVRAAGMMALDALEIRAWRPTQRGEVDARAIPHELDWLRTAVHLNKGCYRGQETVAKVHNLGHPPRRLTLLLLDASAGEIPQPGGAVYLAGATTDSKPCGRVTRAALHYEWGGIALALLKRSVAEDAALEVALGDPQHQKSHQENQRNREHQERTVAERVAATQEIIVPKDAGQTRTIPRLARL